MAECQLLREENNWQMLSIPDWCVTKVGLGDHLIACLLRFLQEQ